MKSSDLIKILENMIKTYGDLEIIFRDEYKNNVYDIRDVLIKFSKNENDMYVITNHFYE